MRNTESFSTINWLFLEGKGVSQGVDNQNAELVILSALENVKFALNLLPGTSDALIMLNVQFI